MECARLKSDSVAASEQCAALSAQIAQLRNNLREFESVKAALVDSQHKIKVSGI